MSLHGDVELACRDCHVAFTWTVAEQEIYAAHGWAEPARCLACRRRRRWRRAEALGMERAQAVADGRPLTCVVCRSTFWFRTGEREFFETRGWFPPRRCPECRRAGLGVKHAPSGAAGASEETT
jgi:hypothetical protein